jgi:hypothetical protein
MRAGLGQARRLFLIPVLQQLARAAAEERLDLVVERRRGNPMQHIDCCGLVRPDPLPDLAKQKGVLATFRDARVCRHHCP